MPSQKDRSAETKARLCRAFRASMLEHGLDATTTDAVLAETGLSKGAMYHHFRSKTDIVEAVYRMESHGAIGRAAAAAGVCEDPVDQLKRSCLAWLEEVREPDTRRILFQLGPQALGMKKVIAIENALSLALLEDLLGKAQQTGRLKLTDQRLAARLINAVLGEIAMHRGVKPAADTVGRLIDGILLALAEQ